MGNKQTLNTPHTQQIEKEKNKIALNNDADLTTIIVILLHPHEFKTLAYISIKTKTSGTPELIYNTICKAIQDADQRFGIAVKRSSVIFHLQEIYGLADYFLLPDLDNGRLWLKPGNIYAMMANRKKPNKIAAFQSNLPHADPEKPFEMMSKKNKESLPVLPVTITCREPL